jgi:hypothetical protein
MKTFKQIKEEIKILSRQQKELIAEIDTIDSKIERQKYKEVRKKLNTVIEKIQNLLPVVFSGSLTKNKFELSSQIRTLIQYINEDNTYKMMIGNIACGTIIKEAHQKIKEANKILKEIGVINKGLNTISDADLTKKEDILKIHETFINHNLSGNYHKNPFDDFEVIEEKQEISREIQKINNNMIKFLEEFYEKENTEKKRQAEIEKSLKKGYAEDPMTAKETAELAGMELYLNLEAKSPPEDPKEKINDWSLFR